MTVAIKRSAESSRVGMTLVELRAFVADADRAGLEDETPIKGTAGWRGQLASVEVSW